MVTKLTWVMFLPASSDGITLVARPLASSHKTFVHSNPLFIAKPWLTIQCLPCGKSWSPVPVLFQRPDSLEAKKDQAQTNMERSAYEIRSRHLKIPPDIELDFTPQSNGNGNIKNFPLTRASVVTCRKIHVFCETTIVPDSRPVSY